MKLLEIALFILVLIGVIALFIWTSRLSSKVFWGQITPTRELLWISLLSAIPVSLLFIDIILFASILDISYTWSITAVIGVLLISLFLGLLGFLGSMWQFFIVGKFRSHLFAKLRRKE